MFLFTQQVCHHFWHFYHRRMDHQMVTYTSVHAQLAAYTTEPFSASGCHKTCEKFQASQTHSTKRRMESSRCEAFRCLPGKPHLPFGAAQPHRDPVSPSSCYKHQEPQGCSEQAEHACCVKCLIVTASSKAEGSGASGKHQF